MAQFSNNDTGLSVRTAINAAIATVDSLGTGDNLLMTQAQSDKLDQLEAVASPGYDAILGYDLSADATTFFSVGTGLSITDTTISADVESVASLTGAITASGLRTQLNVADGAEVNTIDSVPAAAGADQVVNVESLTTAEYTAATKVATTLYLITDAT